MRRKSISNRAIANRNPQDHPEPPKTTACSVRNPCRQAVACVPGAGVDDEEVVRGLTHGAIFVEEDSVVELIVTGVKAVPELEVVNDGSADLGPPAICVRKARKADERATAQPHHNGRISKGVLVVKPR